MRGNRTKIVAFEGMPGAGKTSTIRMLKNILEKRAAVIPQIAIPSLRYIDSLAISQKYLDIEIKKANKIRKLICKGRYEYLFLDRTFLTTLAYAYVRSHQDKNFGSYNKLVEYFHALDAKRHFPRPTLCFLFLVSTQKSIHRRRKYLKMKAFRLWFDPLFLKQMRSFYRKYAADFDMPKPVVINTTSMKPRKIISIVRRYLP